MALTTSTPELALVEPTDRSRTLAFVGPLLLFVHGILSWVDSLGSRPGTGWIAVLSALFLVAAVAALALLTAELGEQTGRGLLASVAVVLAAFGAGATATVSLGRVAGLLEEALPVTLTAGGPILLGVGLALLVFRLALVGRMPLGLAFLATLGAAAIAAPWGLLPLGALLLLIGFGPLTNSHAERSTVARQGSGSSGEPRYEGVSNTDGPREGSDAGPRPEYSRAARRTSPAPDRP